MSKNITLPPCALRSSPVYSGRTQLRFSFVTIKRKAVALLSGGLDSILAVRVILDQGIPVTAIRFMTHFGCGPGEGSSCGHDTSGLGKAWKELGLEIKLCHLGEPYIEMVKKPRFGRGQNMNPCVDCRIMMLSWAKEFLETEGGGFLITGEVLNQRPFSQTRDRFIQTGREAGLEGLILRPLSAKHLPPTRPEIEGIVDRSRLLDFYGRGRKPQYELAQHYGIPAILEELPQPAGGCLLTDPGFSARLKDLWDHEPDAEITDINLLKVGRHFRTRPDCKVIVGRNEQENTTIESLAQTGNALVRVRDFAGPVTLVRGRYEEKDLEFAAAVTARYSDARQAIPVDVVLEVRGREEIRTLSGGPISDESLTLLRVGALV